MKVLAINKTDNYEFPPGLPVLNEPVTINLISNTANNSYKKDTILPCSSTLSYSPIEAKQTTCLNMSSSLIPISNSKQIATELEASYVPEQIKECCLKTQNEAHFNGLIKVEVVPNTNLFMQEETKLRIESVAENNWRALVGEALEEIYGENIINYSAKGKGPD
ncbi:hypothetical protein KQX54_009873 [Cotesia glomerata]|uniref:Vitellogenin n=1 Tax=Cotesia glomerata TaxID=32391 RepID=A0AAV7IVJ2_COTGL|nr:hypothetical protein KQX54_009873 [Cotesia glomerata]